MMCAGVGVDAAVIQAVHDARQGHITKWHYVWPALRLLAGRRNELVLRDERRKHQRREADAERRRRCHRACGHTT